MSVVEGGLPSSFLIITFILLPAGDVKRSDTANTSNSLGECRRRPGKRSFPGPIARWLPGTEFLYSASDSLRMRRACTRDGRGRCRSRQRQLCGGQSLRSQRSSRLAECFNSLKTFVLSDWIHLYTDGGSDYDERAAGIGQSGRALQPLSGKRRGRRRAGLARVFIPGAVSQATTTSFALSICCSQRNGP
jgi:hypothetical protein